MRSHSLRFRKATLTFSLIALAFSNSAPAFPPAPGYTIYGLVRDPFGWVVNSTSAEIIFKEADTGALIAKSQIGSPSIDENYRVMIPLDQERSGESYKPGAITEASPFSIEVVLDGITYFPVETVVTPVDSARASEFLNLDLTLGADSDTDGLPDLWEQWQLEGAGLDTSRLDLIDRDGDLDADGLTNHQEYIAGTFAYLFEDNLNLKIKELGDDGWNKLEFLAVVDKTYTVSESTDLETWTITEFTPTTDQNALVTSWKSPDTILKTVRTRSQSTPTFYRLSVR